MITPNQFEAEQLTGIKITDEKDSLVKVMTELHGLGPKIVIITSTDFGEKKADEIVLYGSQR